MAVGKDGARGVLTTASYEARRFGVGSAMPVTTARRLCPQLIVVPIRMEVYRRESQKIHEVFARYTDLIEPLSLDEAYLDVTEPKQGPPSGTLLAGRIRADIRDAVGLTASVGISYCKFLAKLGSGMNKPDGQTVITRDDAQQLIPTLPVGAFFGVGPKTAARLETFGIHTGQDLQEQTRDFLCDRFGKHGGYLFDIARGIDNRPVNPTGCVRVSGLRRPSSRTLPHRARSSPNYPLSLRCWLADSLRPMCKQATSSSRSKRPRLSCSPGECPWYGPHKTPPSCVEWRLASSRASSSRGWVSGCWACRRISSSPKVTSGSTRYHSLTTWFRGSGPPLRRCHSGWNTRCPASYVIG